MVDLQVIPVERLTALGERFRCDPFAAVIPARTCLARRGATFDGGRMKGHAPKQHPAHPGCAKCPLGAQVAARVTAKPPPTCSEPGCGAPVKGARGRAPKCPAHRGRRG